MYAHQVIEFIKGKDGKCSKYIPDIQKAQHFDIGHIGSKWLDSFAMDKTLRLPYPVTTLSMRSTGNSEGLTKTVCLIYEYDQFFKVLFFHGLGGNWAFIPIEMVVYRNEDEEGKEMTWELITLEDFNKYGVPEKDLKDALLQSLIRKFAIIMAFLCFIDCRNIETIDNPPPDKLNKKRIKSGKQPLFTYKTLVIKPTGKQQQSIPRHLWENRIHLCRGHFKTYTEDAPLFGRLTGRYWWQPSVRGRNREGVVMKDYRVESA